MTFKFSLWAKDKIQNMATAFCLWAKGEDVAVKFCLWEDDVFALALLR